MEIKKLRQYLGLVIAFVIYSLSSIFIKYASLHNILSKKYWVFYVMAIFLLMIYAFLWQRILRRFSLFFAYSAKSMVIIFVLLWSLLIFNERILIQNIIGSLLIILGIVVVNKDVN